VHGWESWYSFPVEGEVLQVLLPGFQCAWSRSGANQGVGSRQLLEQSFLPLAVTSAAAWGVHRPGLANGLFDAASRILKGRSTKALGLADIPHRCVGCC